MRILLFTGNARSIAPTIEYLVETTPIDAIVHDHPNEVDEHLLHSMDAIIVSLPLVPEWWEIESRLNKPLTIPRLIGILSHESVTRRQTWLLGFDAQIGIAQPITPWEWAEQLRTTLESTETRGARSPLDRGTLSELLTGLEHLALADPVNSRILSLLAMGMSDRQIASVMCLSTQSVKNRISKLLHSTHLPNRTALALTYLQTMNQPQEIDPESKRPGVIRPSSQQPIRVQSPG